jgi:DNA polymerase III subunit epsilon
MQWNRDLPQSAVFVDVQTTGLSSTDRVVSLGAIWLSTASVCGGPLPVSYIHLLFNPERRSHPYAERIHGYSHDFLAGQEPFFLYADFVRQYLSSADLIVAHNASSDLLYLNRELTLAGERELDMPVFCTMQGCRRRGTKGAGLEKICADIGLGRAQHTHGALEDAWLSMMVYLWLHECPHIRPFSDCGEYVQPFNLRAPGARLAAAEAALGLHAGA